MKRVEAPPPALVLHHYPTACSQVSVFALEQSRLAYRLHLVDIRQGEQLSAAHLAVSPLGKVPTLEIDDMILTETGGILTWIHATAPDAGLFPEARTPMLSARIAEGLAFCGATLHPLVRGIANPARLTDGPVDGVRSRAAALLDRTFHYAEQRLAEHGWWLGIWSAIDVYLYWGFSRACAGGYAAHNLPLLSSLGSRLEEFPAFRRTLAIETDAKTALATAEAPASTIAVNSRSVQ
jgi:glutathione S-transferase